MAERFGGRYSPDGDRRPPGPPPGTHAGRGGPAGTRTGRPEPGRRAKRTTMLVLAGIPFLFTAFRQEPVGLAVDLSAFGLLALAAWLTREGVIAEDAWAARDVARRPAIPRKLFGAVLTGAALFLGGFVPGAGLLNPLIFAGLGIALHLFAFGLDPMKDKGAEGIDLHEADRVARAVEAAEASLARMADAMRRTGDRALQDRIARFAGVAREMFRTVEKDPRDLTAARRYLGVYLDAARDATVSFADLWERSRDAKARTDYEALIADLESGFAAMTQTMLKDDRSALDIEIEVLRERLQREGIRVRDSNAGNGDAT